MLNIFFSNMSHPAYFEESRNGIGGTMGRGRGREVGCSRMVQLLLIAQVWG